MPTLKGFTFKNQTETSADLYFYGDIVSDWWGAWQDEDQYPDAIKNFLSEQEGKDLNVYVNSGGGSVFAGIAIYNMIKRHAAKANVKRRTVKIGGIDNRQGARYVICLHHKDAVDGDIWVMIVGNNQAGFTISFEKDKETVVDEEITALPMDEEGTLLMYEEEMTESEAAAV